MVSCEISSPSPRLWRPANNSVLARNPPSFPCFRNGPPPPLSLAPFPLALTRLRFVPSLIGRRPLPSPLSPPECAPARIFSPIPFSKPLTFASRSPVNVWSRRHHFVGSLFSPPGFFFFSLFCFRFFIFLLPGFYERLPFLRFFRSPSFSCPFWRRSFHFSVKDRGRLFIYPPPFSIHSRPLKLYYILSTTPCFSF